MTGEMEARRLGRGTTHCAAHDEHAAAAVLAAAAFS